MTPPHRVPHLAQGAWTAHLPGSSPPPRQAYHPSSVPRAQSQRPLAVAATLGSRQRCCRRSASEPVCLCRVGAGALKTSLSYITVPQARFTVRGLHHRSILYLSVFIPF